MELALVLADQGITRMPGFMVENELANGNLISLFEDYQHLQLAIHLVYPSRKHLLPKIRAFIDFVAENISE